MALSMSWAQGWKRDIFGRPRVRSHLFDTTDSSSLEVRGDDVDIGGGGAFFIYSVDDGERIGLKGV
jgi:hypothetical protein